MKSVPRTSDLEFLEDEATRSAITYEIDIPFALEIELQGRRNFTFRILVTGTTMDSQYETFEEVKERCEKIQQKIREACLLSTKLTEEGFSVEESVDHQNGELLLLASKQIGKDQLSEDVNSVVQNIQQVFDPEMKYDWEPWIEKGNEGNTESLIGE